MYYAIAYLNMAGNGFSITEPYVHDDVASYDDCLKQCENMKKSGFRKVTPFMCQENELPENVTWNFVMSHTF